MEMFTIKITLLVFIALVCYQTSAEDYYVGGVEDEDPSEYPEVKEHLRSIFEEENLDDEVVKIISLQTQVVSGIRYIVEFETKNNKYCNAEYIMAEWISEKPDVLSFSCSEKSQR